MMAMSDCIFCVLQEAPFVVLSLIGTVNDSTSFFAQSCKYWILFYDLAMQLQLLCWKVTDN